MGPLSLVSLDNQPPVGVSHTSAIVGGWDQCTDTDIASTKSCHSLPESISLVGFKCTQPTSEFFPRMRYICIPLAIDSGSCIVDSKL